jgi:hypothetical protein
VDERPFQGDKLRLLICQNFSAIHLGVAPTDFH